MKLYVGCIPRTVTEEDVSNCFIIHHPSIILWDSHKFKRVDSSLINFLQ